MAVVTSHTLNSVNGTHAGGIQVTLTRISLDGSRDRLFEIVTDDGGRLMQEIAPDEVHSDAAYELVLDTADYFSKNRLQQSGVRGFREIVVRFEMPDPHARYHFPVMLAPNSYSVWLSSGPNG